MLKNRATAVNAADEITAYRLRRELEQKYFLRCVVNGWRRLRRHAAFALGWVALLALAAALYAGGLPAARFTPLWWLAVAPMPVLVALLTLLALAAYGCPRHSRQYAKDFYRVGFFNVAQELPFLLSERKDPHDPRVTVCEFESHGLDLATWRSAIPALQSALDKVIVKIEQGATQRRVLMYLLPGSAALPQGLTWGDDLLDKQEFVLVLGEGLLGRQTVDLDRVPHILIGGATGSGKTVLTQALAYQAHKKGAELYIADFKGIDMANLRWRCIARQVLTDTPALLQCMRYLLDQIEYRRAALAANDCRGITEYQARFGREKLPRIVFVCDEFAELLDKTGASKEEKADIAKIENALSTIARQGRAFGIHLILATQRPDADVLKGQIKNNIGCRVCGRADAVLSTIILDNGDAAQRIPANSRGLFLTGEGELFQSYYFDDAVHL